MLTAASPLTYNTSEPLSVSGGTGSGTITYNLTGSSGGSCSAANGQLTANSGTGTCTVSATRAGNANYNSVTSNSVPVTLKLAAQTISFTANMSPPASAAYNSMFTVAATASSGLAVAYSSSGACSNIGASYTMTNSTGTCTVTVSQTGNSDYAPATPLTKTVTASGPVITLSTSSIIFGTVYLGSITTKTITVSNTGNAAANISTPLISLLQAGNSDEFVIVNLCPSSLAAGKSCTITVSFVAGAYYNAAQTAMLKIMDSAPGSPQPVSLSATVIDPLASFSPTSESFGTIKHATSSTLDVTLSNPGATSLIFSGAGISITGTNASDFTQTNNCGSSLAAGAKCTIAVKFTPATTGTFSANVTVLDNAQAGSGTQTVPLSGKGN
jgi:hypothetical protein